MKKFLLSLVSSLLPVTAFSGNWTIDSSSSRDTALKNELSAFNSKLSASIRTQKYSKMAASPFTFFRGTAHLYYRDISAANLIYTSQFYDVNAITWIQGDLHTENYGSFDNDVGTIVYDINDFDESWTTSYLYDVYRAAVSIILVAKENGFSDSKAKIFVDSFSESYLDQLADFTNNSQEKTFQIDKSNAYGLLDEFLTDVEIDMSRSKFLSEWTKINSNQRIFKSTTEQPKLAVTTNTEKQTLKTAIATYQQTLTSNLKGQSSYFLVKDVAKRLDAGTGSLGTPRFYVLIEGTTTSINDDRILDVKQQGYPSVYPYLSTSEKNLLAGFNNAQGCRVKTANQALLARADDHLGCLNAFTASFSVRELSPYKESFTPTDLNTETRFIKLAEQWGKILAAAHARADQDYNGIYIPYQFEEIVDQLTDGSHDKFRQEVRDLALNYAKQVAIDYVKFVNLLNQGKL